MGAILGDSMAGVRKFRPLRLAHAAGRARLPLPRKVQAMNVYESVSRWRVPGDLLAKSLGIMRDDGARGCEGIGMWLGTAAAGEATITHLVEIPQVWVEKRPDFLCVSEIAFAALGDICERDGCYLVGQIHSHPGDFIDLSDAD